MRLSQCLPILPLCLMANTVPCANASGCRCIRVWELMRTCLGAETDASGSRGADRNRERRAKHSRSFGRQSEGRIMQHFRGTNIIAFFAKYLSSFTLRKVSYSASLFSAIWKFVSSSLLICQKRFKYQNNFDCLLIICKFAGNPMESYGGEAFSACKQKPFPTTPQGRDREDWGIP